MTATVHEIDGQLVLDDPAAAACFRAVAKNNCRSLLELNKEATERFVRRIRERAMSPRDVVIVLIDVDDVNGRAVADGLMPSYDWQPIRDRGEVPIARGLAGRVGIEEVLDLIDDAAAVKLRAASSETASIVVIAYGVAEVFS